MIPHHLLNIRLDNLSNQELEELLKKWIEGDDQKTIVTPNPEFLLLARHDKEFANILNRSDLSLPDGFGLKLFIPSLRRHTGVDTLEKIAKFPTSICLLGSEKNAKITAKIFKRHNPKIKVSVIDPGIIANDGEARPFVLEAINKNTPTVLAVGLGQGKQERFIARYLSQLPSVRLAIGVGGAFDMISGERPRAPYFMRLLGLEWLWRLIIEPKRWPRIVRAVFIFPLVVFFDSFTKRQK